MQAGDEFPYGEDYEWSGKIFLGEGSYGKVFKVKNIKDGQFYAIKQMLMDEFNKDAMLMESLKGEIKVTQEVNSEHTVKMIAHKIGKKYTYMILEICDTDLRKELA
jgi:serine/threonine protein kinase